MKASRIASLIPHAGLHGPDTEISGITADSRALKPGDAFIALKGSITDGHRYIANAHEHGASAFILNTGTNGLPEGVTAITVPDTRDALRKILPELYPGAAKLRLIGITGTSGKTSTTYLMESILKAAGYNPGVIGTIETRYQGMRFNAELTTPGPIDLFARLEAMHAAGVDTCIMEVSSHALDQDRMAGLAYDYAVFTNLSQDHLDYHKDMGTYFTAKKRLFTEHLRDKAIINIDDAHGRDLHQLVPGALTFGTGSNAGVCARSLKADLNGIYLELATPAGPLTLTSPLLGAFQASNIMAATGVALSMGIENSAIQKGVSSLASIPGRMEPVINPYGRSIIVDYAHKPEALDMALLSARAITPGKLITVFGCGGNRDRSKRPIMGKIGRRHSDALIVTSDNPRDEEPLAIIDEILDGITDRQNVTVEPDRALAIKAGVKLMQARDCLLIAGKGHETYQIIGPDKIPFDDRDCVRKVLKEFFA